jgi:hypothetical protein
MYCSVRDYHNHTSNRWWNLGFISECLNQRAVKAVDAHTFNKQAEKFTQTLSACQKADGNCLLGHERSADGEIHAKRDHDRFRIVLGNAMQKTA